MAIRTRQLVDLNQESFEYLLTNTDITLVSPGSTARALVETANRHLEGFYESLTANLAQAFLSEARGAYLDLHAALFGLTRLTRTNARVQAEDNAIRFFVTSGTLYERLPRSGDLNRALIPNGTTVSSDTGDVIFVVEEDVLVDRTASEVFAPARASVSGSNHNIGAFALRNHSLPNSEIKVTNPIAVTTGADTESDDELRNRIANYIVAQEGGNITAVRLAALSVPGVADVIVREFAYGAGSFELLIVPDGNRVPVAALQRVQSNILSIVGLGTYFQVKEPEYVRFSIIVTIDTDTSVQGDKVISTLNAERAILNHFGDLSPGEELVITQLGADILDADARIKDYKIQALCLDGRQQLLHNVRLRPDELFLPDSNLRDPVKVI